MDGVTTAGEARPSIDVSRSAAYDGEDRRPTSKRELLGWYGPQNHHISRNLTVDYLLTFWTGTAMHGRQRSLSSAV